MGAWSVVKLKEWVEMEKEFEIRKAEGTMPAEATMRNRADRMMMQEGRHYTALRNKPPFINWLDFKGQAQEFFMTTETRDKAIHQLKGLAQKGMPVEDYVIKFKSLVPLTEFNDYALVSQFRQGLNPNLGFDIVRATAPADNDLERWYT